jgi:hypothetical protein
MEFEMEQTNQFRANHGVKQFPKESPADDAQDSLANVRACKVYQVDLQQANDHLRRANRDLGELAGFVAASLTTVTAVAAVINIAVDKIGLAKGILQVAFELYIAFLVAILILGVLRFALVMQRRARAEKELDHAKQGVYRFCPPKQWLKSEE